jgi:hypothetical protein
VQKARESKRVYHIQSPQQVKEFYRAVELELEK